MHCLTASKVLLYHVIVSLQRLHWGFRGLLLLVHPLTYPASRAPSIFLDKWDLSRKIEGLKVLCWPGISDYK